MINQIFGRRRVLRLISGFFTSIMITPPGIFTYADTTTGNQYRLGGKSILGEWLKRNSPALYDKIKRGVFRYGIDEDGNSPRYIHVINGWVLNHRELEVAVRKQEDLD